MLEAAKIEAHAFGHSILRTPCECRMPIEWTQVVEA
jgi:hypothetical protein